MNTVKNGYFWAMVFSTDPEKTDCVNPNYYIKLKLHFVWHFVAKIGQLYAPESVCKFHQIKFLIKC